MGERFRRVARPAAAEAPTAVHADADEAMCFCARRRMIPLSGLPACLLLPAAHILMERGQCGGRPHFSHGSDGRPSVGWARQIVKEGGGGQGKGMDGRTARPMAANGWLGRRGGS